MSITLALAAFIGASLGTAIGALIMWLEERAEARDAVRVRLAKI